VTRVLRLLFNNWPLKLAAIVLATMLYAGLVVSQSAQDFVGSVQVDPMNQPADARLARSLPAVTRIRYISLVDPSARASADSFRATIDLAGVDPRVGSTYVPIKVESVDPRFRVLEWDPQGANVQLDPLMTKIVRVDVQWGTIPTGLEVRPPIISPETVTVTGPASIVDRIVAARADVIIEPSGLDVDRDVDLIPVDILGDRVTPADVEPSTAHVRIPVFSDSRTRPVPVTPIIVGTPADGFAAGAVTVDPLVVTLEGEGDALAAISAAETTPISVSGATQEITTEVDLVLPPDVLVFGGDTKVTVTIEIRPLSGTRTFDAGIRVLGGRSDLDYRLSISHALATVGGSVAELDRLDAATFTLLAEVGGLAPGNHLVTLEANLPVGLSLVGVDPTNVTVTIRVPPSTAPSPAP
jgi:YbbR domain-containing protein